MHIHSPLVFPLFSSQSFEIHTEIHTRAYSHIPNAHRLCVCQNASLSLQEGCALAARISPTLPSPRAPPHPLLPPNANPRLSCSLPSTLSRIRTHAPAKVGKALREKAAVAEEVERYGGGGGVVFGRHEPPPRRTPARARKHTRTSTRRRAAHMQAPAGDTTGAHGGSAVRGRGAKGVRRERGGSPTHLHRALHRPNPVAPHLRADATRRHAALGSWLVTPILSGCRSTNCDSFFLGCVLVPQRSPKVQLCNYSRLFLVGKMTGKPNVQTTFGDLTRLNPF